MMITVQPFCVVCRPSLIKGFTLHDVFHPIVRCGDIGNATTPVDGELLASFRVVFCS